MNEKTPECDHDRLRSLLDDTLGAQEQAVAIAHLDTCIGCQHTLEDLAAGTRWWDALKGLNSAPAGAGSTVGNLFTGPDLTFEDSVGDDDSLGFLAPSTLPGSLGRLGPYEVVGVVGRGGMGIVLKALDPVLGRTVAIKVLAPQLATSASARRRFAREARAAAAIAHEHIVAIHSVDVADGMPYLVMQYIPGKSLQERINESGPLDPREVLRIGHQAASGLAAAHAQGVIHRDIKPSNILLENCLERVKITDFGLARAVDDASLTQSGVVAGTPQYMAPEQTRGEPLDPRSDLFSLGCVLYAACTGHSPFRAETTMAVLRRVNEDLPRPIREVNAAIPDWLATIINRLLAKDPADRFATAAELAEVCEQCLAHLQHPSKFPLPDRVQSAAPARRRRLRAKTAVAALLFVAGLGAAETAGVTNLRAFAATVLRIPTSQGTLVVMVDDPEVKVRIDGEELVVTGAGPQEVRVRPGIHNVKGFLNGVPVKDQTISISRGDKLVVRISQEPLNGPAPAIRAVPERPVADGSPWVRSGPPAVVDERGESVRVVERASEAAAKPTAVWSLAVRPDGRVAVGHSGALRIWDLASRRVVAEADTPGMTLGAVAFSADGKLVASGEHSQGQHVIVIREARTGKAVQSLLGHPAGINSVAFSPDGKELISCGWDKPIRIWDVVEGRPKRTLLGHDDQVTTVAYSPDGTLIASSSLDHTARLWDARTLKPKAIFKGHEAGLQRVVFSPDGKLLATGSFDNTIRIWDITAGQEQAVLLGHEAPVLALAFSPDGHTLASAASLWGSKYQFASKPSELRLWDVTKAETKSVLTGHASHVFALGFAPDGKTLISGSLDATMRLWDVGSGREQGQLDPRMQGAGALALAYSPDGKVLASAEADRTVALRDPATRKLSKTFRGLDDTISCLAFSPDGKTLATGSFDKTLKIWDVETGRVNLDLGGHTERVFALAFSPDGKTLASGGSGKVVRLWDTATGALRATLRGHTAEIRTLAFSADGKTLASGGGSEGKLWDVASATARCELRRTPGTFRSLVFLPDGKTLASAGEEAGVNLWDVPSGAHRLTLASLGDPITSLACSPTGRTLAGGGSGSHITLWHMGEEGLTMLRGPRQSVGVASLAFAPVGWQLAAAGTKGDIAIWETEAPQQRPIASLGDLNAQVWTAAFTPDGKSLIVGGKSNDLWISSPPAVRARVLTPAIGATWTVAFSPDGKTYATAGWYTGWVIKLWDAATNQLLRDLAGHTDNVRFLAYSPDSKVLASASYDHTVRLWDVGTGKSIAGPPEQDLPVNVVRFFPDGKSIAFAIGDWQAHQEPGAVVIWELGRTEPRAVLRGHSSQVASVAIAPDGKTVASAGVDGIRLWDVSSASLRAHVRPAATSTNALEYSPDGRFLASGQHSGEIVLWDTITGREAALLRDHAGVIFRLTFSPDGQTLASCGRDNTLKLWQVPPPRSGFFADRIGRDR